MAEKPRIFYGWWIVAAALGILFVMAGTAFYSFSVLIKPLMAEFGWTRGIISLGQTVSSIASAVTGLVVGNLVQRYSVKKILFAGGLIGGIGLILLSLTPNIWYFYIMYALVGIGMGAAGTVPIGVVIANWFNRKLGIAMGIATVGIAMGAMILVPITGVVIQNFGWQTTYIFFGLVVFAIDIPLALFVFKLSPREMGLNPDGDARYVGAEPRSSMNQVVGRESGGLKKYMKSPGLWLLCVGFTLCNIGELSILTHEVPYITDIGIPATMAAVALGFTGGLGALGKLAFGSLTDWLSARYVAMLCFALQLVGILILMQAKTMATVWVFVVIFGFAMGGFVTMLPLVINDIFGKANFGVIFGFIHLIVIGGATIGPPFAGFIYDMTGSYSVAFTVFTVTYILSIALTYFAFGLNPRPFKSLRKSAASNKENS